ncbi:MAG TPA: 2-oxo acid dehydrogenase subunit E2 [Polyangiaceae bacterium]|nr:2-oxo acid dehydrogenase subunit E2 [Polyangiaceae bacterium]
MNLKLVRKRNLSMFRKIALGTWRDAYDPSVYGTIELKMDRALAYLAAFRAKTGKRATVTHLVAKAAAQALRETPEANALLRWNRVYLRQDVGVFFQVAIADDGHSGIDLSGLVIHAVDQKNLTDICQEFETAVHLVRTRTDETLERTRRTMNRMPGFFMHWALRISAFVAYTLNWNPRLLGVPRDAFGSVMITNVGSLGLDVAYPPLVAYSRVPILLATGVVKDAPVVVDGALGVAKVMNVSVTFDHRFIDGVHAANMAKTLREWIENPFEHFDRLEE